MDHTMNRTKDFSHLRQASLHRLNIANIGANIQHTRAQLPQKSKALFFGSIEC
jgi:hypothetical protein